MTKATRRGFLKATAAGAGGVLAGAGDWSFLNELPAVSAAEAKLDSQVVKLQPEIEPLVRLVEETPRGKLLEEVAAKIRGGTTYIEVLAALLLAGVRNIQPRPSVGFKFHAVLVVNSAHLASISSPAEHRWLPIFWALDEFKSSQAKDVQEGDWTMKPVDESRIPTAEKAREAFIAAIENWDEAAVDTAVAGLARTAEPKEVYELFYRYGARDFRDIGHKAIFVANSRRTLDAIGWRHAEPVLRSLAFALQKHEGSNPAKRDGEPDLPWRQNVERAKKIRQEWQSGKLDDAATTDLLATLRKDSAADASNQVVEMLNRGVSPQSIWDALFVGSGELVIRQPGIPSIHAVTTSNALRYAYDATASDDTRRMMLLQCAAFVPLFRQTMAGRGGVAEFRLDQLAAAEPAKEKPLDEIFLNISRDKMAAARNVLAYLKGGGSAKELIDAARLLVFMKGEDSHDYKFSTAALEDFEHVSPAWRDRFLASSVYKLRGSADKENRLVARTRAALQG